MKIVDITLQREKIPLEKPFITALRKVEFVEFIRVFVTTDNGHIGIGEAPATKAITGEDLESIELCISRVIKNQIINKNIDEAFDILHSTCNPFSSAKATVDIALHDILTQDNPNYFLHVEGSVKSDVTISLNDVDTMINDSKEMIERGYNILKVKVGANDGEDAKRVLNIASALPQADILVDANQAWNEETSIEIINTFNSSNVKLVEQPVKAKNLSALKSITEKTTMPILADESAFSLNDVKNLVENSMVDMINIKLMKCGGITKAVEILEYCRKHDVKCMMGSMLEGPYSIKAAIKLSIIYADIILYSDLDSPILYHSSYNNDIIKLSNNRLFISLL